MLGRLVAILTFSRRTESLTGPAKVIDGDTIVVAGQLVRLHGIDAPELDQTFMWRGQEMGCGAMSLAALEALIAGVKVRCEVVERDRHGRLVAKVFSLNGVDIGRRLVLAGPVVPAVLDERRRRRGTRPGCEMWTGTFAKRRDCAHRHRRGAGRSRRAYSLSDVTRGRSAAGGGRTLPLQRFARTMALIRSKHTIRRALPEYVGSSGRQLARSHK